MHEVHRERRYENRDADRRGALGVFRVHLLERVGAFRELAHQAASLLGEVSGPAEHIRHQLPLESPDQRAGAAGFGDRALLLGGREVVEDRAQVAVETGRAGLGLRRCGPIEILEREMQARDVLVVLGVRHERLALGDPVHRAVAELELGERGGQLRVVRTPIARRRHPDRKRLGPVLVGMLLRVPARQVAHEPPAERLRAIVLAVRLRDRAEQLHPVLVVVEPVGVVHDVTHLVAQIAEDVGAVEALDVPHLLAMQLGELGTSEIERNCDRDRAERHAPLRG
jgi:hypothetical protein